MKFPINSERCVMPYALTIRELNYSWAGRPSVRCEYPTEDEARAALTDYVVENWDGAVGTDLPDDPDEMVDMYFSVVHEAYEIEREWPVLPSEKP
jgi:hypothetical protein